MKFPIQRKEKSLDFKMIWSHKWTENLTKRRNYHFQHSLPMGLFHHLIVRILQAFSPPDYFQGWQDGILLSHNSSIFILVEKKNNTLTIQVHGKPI